MDVLNDVTELIKLENEEETYENEDEPNENEKTSFVIPSTYTSNTMNYHNINVKNLKIMAISKGLCSDTTKMKRADLIKILTEDEKN